MTNAKLATPNQLSDLSTTLKWQPSPAADGNGGGRVSTLKMPTLGQLLESSFKERKHLLKPWLREQESCMVYAGTGIGKSLFALSAAIAVAGNGEFLGWPVQPKSKSESWRVLYIDGEMHIADIQKRAAILVEAIPDIDRDLVERNLMFLSRQHQDPRADFPSITEASGMRFIAERIRESRLDLIILDNFSTLGEVEDENDASSFNRIQEFLLGLKVQGVATMLIHHAGKGGDFRGSSKLAATFETIIKLDRAPSVDASGQATLRVCWDKVRAGGERGVVRDVLAHLTDDPFGKKQAWNYESAEGSRLEQLKELLASGEVINKKEIADYFGVSKTAAGKYIDKGVAFGFWTQLEVGRWFAKGRRLRTEGKTSPPDRPKALESLDDDNEAADDTHSDF